MRTIRTFVVVPSLPAELSPLKDIAYNLHWCWDPDAVDLFRRLDSDLWAQCYHNPVKMLGKLSQERVEAVSRDTGFMSLLDRVQRHMEIYMNDKSWFSHQKGADTSGTIAYFSAEYGLHESLPIYSGGLGILAGDHLKSASDLGVNLVAVGLLYRQGYFQQYLNADGWQQESYPDNDFYNMALNLVMQQDGRPLRFHIDIGGHEVVVQVWKVQVGRISLYLLDSNLRCNRIEDRQITAQLYGGDSTMRIRQEIILGIGGYQALKKLGIEPVVCHMNEGHAAFMALERIRDVMSQKNISFAQAREATICGNVFTTHTPVPAGHDVFSATLMEKFFANYSNQLQLKWSDFLAIGRIDPQNNNEPFSMTNLALKLSTYRNGVSKLHGEVSRQMCQSTWKGVPEDEIPITSITNGIHIHSWISPDMSYLYNRYIGPNWGTLPGYEGSFAKIEQIPDEELWRTHERRRERLVSFARKCLKTQLQSRGGSPSEIAMAEEVLDPEALTIGFARRFATYKRGTLLFRDLERFAKILSNKDRPVQIIFAGKAHPNDTEGKELIRKIVHMIQNETFRGRVVFLENYDINVARYLVQGVDVWLNTPRRGMEASGTSGMKVLSNGGLNLSILDGWWCEGYAAPECVGWAIGQGESYSDKKYEEEVESRALYNILEKEVIPTFYDRGADHLPRKWIRLMKNSIKYISAKFATARMVAEYTERFYLPCSQRWHKFNDDNMAKAKELADWKESIRDRWSEVEVGKVDILTKQELQVGSSLEVRCQIKLGSIDPGDVIAELYYGPIDSAGTIQNGQAVAMEAAGKGSDGNYIFNGFVPCRYTGQCGFAVRIMPNHRELSNKYETGLILWEQPAEDKNAAKVQACTMEDTTD